MRSILSLLLVLLLGIAPVAAQNANPAEAFIAGTIRDGFAILDNPGLSADARATQLESLLLAATDMRRIALFTLGDAPATAEQREAFVAAFRDYALSVYRAQFMTYAGRTMTVTGSRQNAPGDIVVRTSLSAIAGNPAQAVEFRVRTDGPSPVIIDVGFSGIWLALTQRDDFAAFLGRNKGDVAALTADLAGKARR